MSAGQHCVREWSPRGSLGLTVSDPQLTPVVTKSAARHSGRMPTPFAHACPVAHALRGAKDRGEYRQAAGAFAEAVIRSVELIVQPDV